MEQNWLYELSSLITKRQILDILTAVLILLVGLLLSRRVSLMVSRLGQLDINQRVLFTKVARYGILTLAIAAALNQVGFDLRVLLGAAGVLTVAVGFASQTSASNLISGLFLMIERPFSIGDTISLGDLRGQVMSIDLLSSKIRTFNNMMVRIPNETMVKSNITNHSYFPIRRLDFNFTIVLPADISTVEHVLKAAASKHPFCLDEPESVFLVTGFAEGGAVNVQFQMWTLNNHMVVLQSDYYREVKKAFEDTKIEIAFPKLGATAPLQPAAPSTPPTAPGMI